MVGEKILAWFDEWQSRNTQTARYLDALDRASSAEELDLIYGAMPAEYQDDPRIQEFTAAQREKHKYLAADIKNPLVGIIQNLLDGWVEKVEKYDLAAAQDRDKILAELTAEVMTLSGGALLAELSLGALPNDEGTVASNSVSRMMAWLGFGAVITAVAHDPVKIGLLRPYQDSLEAKFRNRRPGDIALFQAYRTRELSPVKVDDLSKLDEKEMDRIEADNEKMYFAEIAKWGYSEWFATALSRSATITPSFTQLNALARQGLLDKGMAIYSLWGSGYDRITMKPLLDALMAQNRMASYEGFRSMVEPSYVEGDIEEADLREYWTRIMVPADVQEWVIPRLRKRREAALAKAKGQQAQKERDLTVSQVTQAYQADLIKRPEANNSITALGYSQKESDILLNLAETRKKAGGATTLKRLTLTDYEKAYKAGIISLDAVLERMKGEYAPADIDLEKKLLEADAA